MTAKEKAKELFYTYASMLPPSLAKMCALRTVSEVLNVVSRYNDTQNEFIYWTEVKQEIEIL